MEVYVVKKSRGPNDIRIGIRRPNAVLMLEVYWVSKGFFFYCASKNTFVHRSELANSQGFLLDLTWILLRLINLLDSYRFRIYLGECVPLLFLFFERRKKIKGRLHIPTICTLSSCGHSIILFLGRFDTVLLSHLIPKF